MNLSDTLNNLIAALENDLRDGTQRTEEHLATVKKIQDKWIDLCNLQETLWRDA